MSISAPITAGVGLLAIASYMFYKQSKAKSCDRHNRNIGRLAMIVAALCVVGGICLIVGGIALLATG